MADFNFLADRLAAETIRERVSRAERDRLVRRHRRSSRHSLASSLHHLAERIDN
jgi:hypothetical protein